MSSSDDISQQLLENALVMIFEKGLSDVSMRAVADTADCSTTAIVQRFGNKAGLLKSVAAFALEKDRVYHDALLRQLEDGPLSFPYFSDVLVTYIEQRSKNVVARVWSEILFSENVELASSDVVRAWYQSRLQFWQAIFQRAGLESTHSASVVTTYVIMEEVYAFELSGDFEYRLLLKETCRALLAGLLQVDDSAKQGHASVWATKGFTSYKDFPERSAITLSISENESAKKLLDTAAVEIFNHGIGSLNKRRVSKLAGMSSSMISYHFGNQADFINFAVWEAFWRDPPLEFKTPYDARNRQKDVAEWVGFIQRMTSSGANGRSVGFYARFSRLTAQAGLLSDRRPPLRALFRQVRRIDGWGTYEAGRTFWPSLMKVERGSASAFGIWVKGAAAINFVLNSDDDVCGEELSFIAKNLFH